MTFTDLVKSVAELIAQVNKAEDNAQQKKFLSTLRQIKKQEKNSKKHLVIGIIVSSIGSAVVGLVLGKFFLN